MYLWHSTNRIEFALTNRIEVGGLLAPALRAVGSWVAAAKTGFPVHPVLTTADHCC
jgi:hypothetical protein